MYKYFIIVFVYSTCINALQNSNYLFDLGVPTGKQTLFLYLLLLWQTQMMTL